MHKFEPISRREFIAYSASLCAFLSNSSFRLKTTYSLEELMGIAPKNLIKQYDYTLNKEAAEAFNKMRASAQKDGVLIKVVSSFRSYDHQKKIWNNKFNKYISQGYAPDIAIREIIKYSTIPGTSRHHWGSDLDIIQANVNKSSYSQKDPLNEKYFTKNAVFYPLKLWLNKNAYKFGFYEVYTNDINRTGFKYEPWHFSYKPISKVMLKDFMSYNLAQELLKHSINGKSYITSAFIKSYVNNYIMGINKILI